MSHCDPEVLALIALGDLSPDTPDADHLRTCAVCRGELDELGAVVSTARAARPEDRPQAPPARVWSAITAELGLALPLPGQPSPAPTPAVPPPPPSADVPLPPPSAARLAAQPGSGPDAEPGSDAPAHAGAAMLAPRRRRTWLLTLAAVVAGIVVGTSGTYLALADRQPTETLVAETALKPLPSWQGTGQAKVVDNADGSRSLFVTVRADATGKPTGYREVWLIDRGVSRLVPLGVLQGQSGTFAIPAGVDLDEYALVDVSLEPYNGDPAHSGDSIVRGTLPA